MLSQSTAGQSAGPTDPAGLVLERLPNGELAWLHPELDGAIRDAEQLDQDLTRRLGWPEPQPQPEPEDVRYTITDLGRRALAMARLFGPWVNVAGRKTWADPHQKPGDLCATVWACGEPRHHHNCSDCAAHCRLGITAQDHERADPSDRRTAAHCDCASCVAHRDEASAA